LPNTVKWYHLGILCTYSKRPVGALAIAVLLRFDANLHALLGLGAILGFFIPELGYFNHPRAQYRITLVYLRVGIKLSVAQQ
jgi:hypothetical protein